MKKFMKILSISTCLALVLHAYDVNAQAGNRGMAGAKPSRTPEARPIHQPSPPMTRPPSIKPPVLRPGNGGGYHGNPPSRPDQGGNHGGDWNNRPGSRPGNGDNHGNNDHRPGNGGNYGNHDHRPGNGGYHGNNDYGPGNWNNHNNDGWNNNHYGNNHHGYSNGRDRDRNYFRISYARDYRRFDREFYCRPAQYIPYRRDHVRYYSWEDVLYRTLYQDEYRVKCQSSPSDYDVIWQDFAYSAFDSQDLAESCCDHYDSYFATIYDNYGYPIRRVSCNHTNW